MRTLPEHDGDTHLSDCNLFACCVNVISLYVLLSSSFISSRTVHMNCPQYLYIWRFGKFIYTSMVWQNEWTHSTAASYIGHMIACPAVMHQHSAYTHVLIADVRPWPYCCFSKSRPSILLLHSSSSHSDDNDTRCQHEAGVYVYARVTNSQNAGPFGVLLSPPLLFPLLRSRALKSTRGLGRAL